MQLGRGQIRLDETAGPGRVGQEVHMHLVRADLRTFVAKVGKVQRHRIVLRVAEGKCLSRAVLMTPHQNEIGLRESRAADKRIDAMQITPSRGPTPIVECLVESRFGAHQCRLVGRTPGLGRSRLRSV